MSWLPDSLIYGCYNISLLVRFPFSKRQLISDDGHVFLIFIKDKNSYALCCMQYMSHKEFLRLFWRLRDPVKRASVQTQIKSFHDYERWIRKFLLIWTDHRRSEISDRCVWLVQVLFASSLELIDVFRSCSKTLVWIYDGKWVHLCLKCRKTLN